MLKITVAPKLLILKVLWDQKIKRALFSRRIIANFMTNPSQTIPKSKFGHPRHHLHHPHHPHAHPGEE